MEVVPVILIGEGALGLRFALQLRALSPLLITRRTAISSMVVRSVDAAQAPQDEIEISCKAFDSLTSFPENAYVFVCTKVHALEGVIVQINARLTGSQSVVLCQNGLGVFDYAALKIPSRFLIRLMARFGAFKPGPGLVRPSGPFAVTLAGDGSESMALSRVEQLVEVLRQTGAEVAVAKSPKAAEWQKGLINIVTNSLATLVNAPNGVLLDDAHLWSVAEQIMTECIAVAKADQVEIGDEFSESEVRGQIERYRSNTNSTLVDLRAGRATEIHWLIGALVRRAAELSISVPVSSAIHNLLLGVEKRGLLTGR